MGAHSKSRFNADSLLRRPRALPIGMIDLDRDVVGGQRLSVYQMEWLGIFGDGGGCTAEAAAMIVARLFRSLTVAKSCLVFFIHPHCYQHVSLRWEDNGSDASVQSGVRQSETHLESGSVNLHSNWLAHLRDTNTARPSPSQFPPPLLLYEPFTADVHASTPKPRVRTCTIATPSGSSTPSANRELGTVRQSLMQVTNDSVAVTKASIPTDHIFRVSVQPGSESSSPL